MPVVFIIILMLLAGPVSSPLLAQEAVESRPVISQQVEEPKEPNFIKEFLQEQRDIWTSPFKVRRGDVKWLAPISAGAAALLATDWRVSNAALRTEELRKPSRILSNFGGGIPLTAASVSMWTIGKMTRNEKAARTGRLATEAVLNTELLIGGIKLIANRERPNKLGGNGEFFGGGQSFPSGHAATSFALATVVAHEYRDKPWLAIGSYGLATAVSLSRVGGLKHFPSDIFIGATIGHLVARYILRRHD